MVGDFSAQEGLPQLLTEQLGVRIQTVEDLQSARQWLLESTTSLILIKENLPDGTALDLLQDDRDDLDYPIIVIGQSDSPDSLQHAIDHGAFDYLPEQRLCPETITRIVRRKLYQWQRQQQEKSRRRRLHESDKLTAIGQLAGGIAHDFNNQLAVINGFAEILLMKMPGDDSKRDYLKQILNACKRCSSMTQELLAFGRRGNYRVVSLNLRQLLEAVISWLQHSNDVDIRVHRDFDSQPLTVLGDPDQLHDVFLNLVRNARDSMPDGGDIWLHLRPREIEPADIEGSPFDLQPGSYLEVIIADNGHGMDEKTRRHAFEPFFTTRPNGEGRGMGLSAAYGSIVNHLGAIELESKPDEGTTVRVLLPRSEAPIPEEIKTLNVQPTKKQLTILLVDDEIHVAQACGEILELLGHSPHICHNGEDALTYYGAHQDEIDLVIMDMVMPSMSGATLFQALQQVDPDVKVLISSGYSMSDDIQETLKAGALGLIQKPFTVDTLSRRLESLGPQSSHG